MNTRIIVCGNKDFRDREFCLKKLKDIIPQYANPEIVSGHAKEVDTFGEEFAESEGIKCTVFEADWEQYGRAVDPIRNKEMLQYAREENPIVIAF